MKIAYTPEHQRTARSATAKTAHRWRKRLKVKQLKIDQLEAQMAHVVAQWQITAKSLERYTRDAML